MRSSLLIARVAGIPIRIHYTWFFIAVLITLSLAGQFRRSYGDWPVSSIWVTAIATAVLFFVTLLLHELSHALVARRHGLPVRSITLFALGGVARIDGEASRPRTEFLVAIVGPITSLVVGIALVATAAALGWRPADGAGTMRSAMLGWLGAINIGLAVFNMIPGYPLDGGRVLRAILWAVYKDRHRSMRTAAIVGQCVAAVLVAIGLLQFLTGAGFGALWISLIGWFLLAAAQASYADALASASLREVRVADIMVHDCTVVPPHLTLRALVDDIFMRGGHRCVLVRDDDRVLGLVTLQDVPRVERARWADVTVAGIMRPLDQLESIHSDAPAAEALARLGDGASQLPVVDDGRLVGVVTREHVMEVLQSRRDLAA
jgi:Zn-dependent protease/predicted transcriptional regulator